MRQWLCYSSFFSHALAPNIDIDLLLCRVALAFDITIFANVAHGDDNALRRWGRCFCRIGDSDVLVAGGGGECICKMFVEIIRICDMKLTSSTVTYTVEVSSDNSGRNLASKFDMEFRYENQYENQYQKEYENATFFT